MESEHSGKTKKVEMKAKKREYRCGDGIPCVLVHRLYAWMDLPAVHRDVFKYDILKVSTCF